MSLSTEFIDIHDSKEDYGTILDDFAYKLQNYLVELKIPNSTACVIANCLAERMSDHKLYYHTPVHILSIFDFAKRNNIELEDYEKIAIWFHDAIYDTYKPFGQNELLSADFMKALLTPYLSVELIDDVHRVICETANHLDQDTYPPANKVLDLDIFTFCTTPKNLDFITECIFKEFQPIERTLFNQNRKKFLQSLIKKGYIYRTDLFREKFESLAMDNITKEIESL